MKFLRQLTWQAAAVILGGGAMFTLIVLFAPTSVLTLLLGANGLVFAVLGLLSNWRRMPE